MSSRRDGDLIGGGIMHAAQAVGTDADGKTLWKGETRYVSFGVYLNNTTAGELNHMEEVTTNASHIRTRWDQAANTVRIETSTDGVRWATKTSVVITLSGGTTVTITANVCENG